MAQIRCALISSSARVERQVKKYWKKEVQSSRPGRPGRQKEVPPLKAIPYLSASWDMGKAS